MENLLNELRYSDNFDEYKDEDSKVIISLEQQANHLDQLNIQYLQDKGEMFMREKQFGDAIYHFYTGLYWSLEQKHLQGKNLFLIISLAEAQVGNSEFDYAVRNLDVAAELLYKKMIEGALTPEDKVQQLRIKEILKKISE